MSTWNHFLRSVLLTMLLSFMMPLVCIAMGLITLTMISYLPVLAVIGHIGCEQMVKVLAVFGTGHPLQGCLVIGITCSLVGGLFDTYASCQNFRSN